jgi:drug/metabolite transporter (DMT)-like permease
VLVQLAIRSVVAFALLLGWMRWRGIRWSFTDGTLWPGLLCGLLFAVEFGLALGALFYQGVIVTFASYLLWFWLLTRYPATKVQAFVFLSPVFGTLCAGWLLGEPITSALVGALVGVGIGLAMLNRV